MQLHCGDCLDVMSGLPDQSVDMVLCDLPYGTTACAWDAVIPFAPLWEQYWRLAKPNAAVVLTASQPFTTALISSQIEHFKYEWIWMKNRPTNFAHAKNKPMKKHENVLVFSKGTTVHATQSGSRMPYFPQGLVQITPKIAKKSVNEKTKAFFSDRPSHREFMRDATGFPHSVLEFSTEMKNVHPTAKPVALMEYLVRTYTREGDVVLDNTMGSGTTGVACVQAGRDFIGIERDADYFEIAKSRIGAAKREYILEDVI